MQKYHLVVIYQIYFNTMMNNMLIKINTKTGNI